MLRLVIFLFLGIFSTLLMLGNKNGRASQAQRGNTGAPGDETQGGQPKTCMSCHNQGPIVASVAISVLDSSNNPVTQYMPGEQYTARVTITASGGNLQGYGFQMIGLRDNGNTDLDGFADMNPNNYKIATIPGGRTYAEHDNISPTNTFNVKWTAPATGTGSVTFYASGNGVNANGTTSGDGAGKHSLQLTEISSPTVEIEIPTPSSYVLPNPVQSEAVLHLKNFESGKYRLAAFDAAGRMVWETGRFIPKGASTIDLPSIEWAPGVYFLTLESGGKMTSVKVLKL